MLTIELPCRFRNIGDPEKCLELLYRIQLQLWILKIKIYTFLFQLNDFDNCTDLGVSSATSASFILVKLKPSIDVNYMFLSGETSF